jgi:pilus assembly protein CpaE
MSGPTPIFTLLSPDTLLEGRLRQVLRLRNGDDLRRWPDSYCREDPARVAAAIAAAGTSVVCLGPELPAPVALALAHAFDVEHPEVAVVMLAEPTAALWHGSLRAGVRGVVSPAADDDEIRAIICSAVEAAARRRVAGVGPQPATKPTRVIVVVSPKGGSGKTMVAVNLAVALARVHPNEVALLDLDVQFGDVASGLHLLPEHSLVDVVRSGAAIDATSLKVLLTAHASTLWVLAAPELPADADEVTAPLAARTLQMLATEFPIVVVDTGAGLDELTLAAAELATDLVFVPTMDVSSIRGLRKELAVLDSLGLTTAKRHVALNRADSKVGLDLRDVEAALGLPVDVALASSRAVPLAVNQGLALVESDPRAAITRQLDELAGRFRLDPTPEANDSGWLRRRKESR